MSEPYSDFQRRARERQSNDYQDLNDKVITLKLSLKQDQSMLDQTLPNQLTEKMELLNKLKADFNVQHQKLNVLEQSKAAARS